MKYWGVFNKIYTVVFAFIVAPVGYDWFKAESISKRSLILFSISLAIGILSFITQQSLSLYAITNELKAITKNRDGLVNDWKRLKAENEKQKKDYERDLLEYRHLLETERAHSYEMLNAFLEIERKKNTNGTKGIQDHKDN